MIEYMSSEWLANNTKETGVELCSATNSTPFCKNCGAACIDEEYCPGCGRKVIPEEPRYRFKAACRNSPKSYYT